MVGAESVTAKGVLAAVVVVGAVAGGVVLFSSDDGATSAIDQVPAEADTVARLDMTITDDRATQLLAVASGASMPAVDNGSDLPATVENRTGLDPEQAREVVVFSAARNTTDPNATDYVGAVVHTDADTDTAVGNLRDAANESYEERTVDGQSLYAPSGASGYWIGVLGEGQLVVGTGPAVRDSISVAAGDAEPAGGDLRTAYDGTHNRTVRFATTSPDVLLPANAGFVTNVQLYRDLRSVSGSYYLTGSRTGIELQLRANSEANAQSVAQATNGTVAVVPTYVDNESTAEAVRSVTVTREGSTVVVTYEAPMSQFQRVLGYLYGVS